MSDAGDALSPINFTFEHIGHGWAHASISDGAETFDMAPSYLSGDPLFLLVQAVVGMLRDGDEHTGCEWWYEPSLDRWDLYRRGDTLHIVIRGRPVGKPSASVSAVTPSWFWSSAAAGAVRFRATYNEWSFAAQGQRCHAPAALCA